MFELFLAFAGQMAKPDSETGKVIYGIEIEKVQRQFMEWYALLRQKGLSGVAKWGTDLPLEKEDVIAIFLLGASGGGNFTVFDLNWKDACSLTGFPECLDPAYYQPTLETED